MNFLATTFLALGALGADQRLIPSARLESGAEVEWAEVSHDGKSLVGVSKDGKQHDLAVWDIPSKSRTVLLKGADALYVSVSPDGRALLACICTMEAESLRDMEFIAWDMRTKSKTSLLKLKKTYVSALPGKFSADGTLVAIPDGFAKKIHIWKRNAAAKWNALRVLDVGPEADTPKSTLLEIALTPDGKQILGLLPLINGTSDDGSLTIQKWNVTTGQRVPFPMKPMKAFTTMAGQLLFISGEKTLWIERAEGEGEPAVGMDTSSGKRKCILPFILTGASISPDGRTGAAIEWVYGTTPSRATVAFWNFEDATNLRQVTVPSGTERPMGAFTSDSRFFVLAAGKENRYINVIDANKAEASSSFKVGGHVFDVNKAEVRSSFAVGSPVKGLFSLNSGEIAAVGLEPKLIVIWKIKTP